MPLPKCSRITRRTSIYPLLITIVLLLPSTSHAFLTLDKARVEHLDNGLTLIVLEDHTFPVVSVHMLYRVGARNETAGATGLAHFLEHMAFRDSENFPDTGLVSSIYAVGGEWHGYTWLDQTNYFATAPKSEIDLLLRIEADRMARLLIPAEDMEAERGAVLTELHSYENDPGSVLLDNLMYLTFLAHPYRNNTIGWESDVANLSHADALGFYQAHYHPGNAVLAVVGDVKRNNVRGLIERYFAALSGRAPTPPPHTVEPPQSGERRLRLTGELDRRYFKMAWRAPSSNHADYAAMLVAQELLGGGSGVSFLQNEWGTPARDGSALASRAGALCDDLNTWYPPSAQDYVFVISGSVPVSASESEVEQAIEDSIAQLGSRLSEASDNDAEEVARARHSVQRELLFDVQTTEDAAHQLAYFSGLGALDALSSLPESLNKVSAGDVSRVLNTWLRTEQRNIAWYGPPPGEPTDSTPAVESQSQPSAAAIAPVPAEAFDPSPITTGPIIKGMGSDHPAGLPVLKHLKNGLPVIIQSSPLSPTVTLRVVTPWAKFPADAPAISHQPVWGVSSLDFALLADQLEVGIRRARTALGAAIPGPRTVTVVATDPDAMLQSYFSESLGLSPAPPAATGSPSSAPDDFGIGPMLIVVTGAIKELEALELVERGLGDLPMARFEAPPTTQSSGSMDIESTLPVAVAQEQLGYTVRAPAPGDPAAPAWQMALYILTHGYEGRLGMEAITRRGLVYYVDSVYRTDGSNGWIELSIGVDPAKQPAMKALLREELQDLVSNPPTQEEIDEARRHLLGRRISAAQSNPELADVAARDWFMQQAQRAETQGADTEWVERLNSVTRDEVIQLLPAFTSGSIIAIRSPR